MEYLDTVKSLLTPILTETCVTKYFDELDFFDEKCLKHTISKGLGIGIIAGSILVKVPQILKITRGRSAAGITFISVVMELFAITSNMSYSYVQGFPFSAWGEACFLAIQTSIIALLVIWYNYGSALLALGFLGAYGASVYSLVSGVTPLDVLWSMQAANVPIIVISKFLQAMTNYRNQSTGQLSAVTVFMLFLGSVARIFTSIQETGDNVIIVTYATSSLVNGVIASQILWYWNSGLKKKAVKGGKGAPKGAKGGKAGTTSPKKGSINKTKKK